MSDAATPPNTPPAAPEAQWHQVGNAADWQPDSGKRVTVGARRIGIFKHDNAWWALKDICPHAGVPLAQGPVSGGTVMCVGHGWRFSLKTGEWVDGSPVYKVATYPVRVTDAGVVEVLC